jgi:NAD(P)-dependent dehydrogenase (short-subunit alcohol dehydrogenase family)
MTMQGRVAMVAGVGPGIGRETALALARERADLVLCARSERKTKEVAEEVEGLGRRALCVAMDVAQAADRVRAVEKTIEQFGRLDALVANAYAMGGVGPADEVDPETWRDAFEVNVIGTIALAQAAARPIAAQGGGSIVIVSSMAGRRPEPLMAGYGASKAALMHAARCLATDLGPSNVRVNIVVPGWVDGPQLQVHFQLEAKKRGISEQEVYREVAAHGLLPRVATAREIAQAIAFFASERASGLTGQTLDVNAGAWLG